MPQKINFPPKLQKIIHTKNFFISTLILVILIALFFRFANFSTRWTLSQDQARDAIISRHAIESGQIPLIGPHSSAGEFSFGPIYYWLTTLFTFLTQPIINGSWYLFAALSFISVLIFAFIGYRQFGRVGALIFGSIAALSSGQILHASDMLNPIPIAFVVFLILFSLSLLINTKNIRHSILLGLLCGIALNFHFQSLILMILFPVASFIVWDKSIDRIKGFISMLAGALIGLLPILFFDFFHQNILSKNFLTFLLSGQKTIATQLSWFDDLTQFWPALLGEVINNVPIFGYSIIILFLGAILWSKFIFRDLDKLTLIILIALGIQILSLHFYKGPRTPVYMIVFHPMLIYLFAWSLYICWRSKKAIALSFLTIALLVGVFKNWEIINGKNQLEGMTTIQQAISKKSAGQLVLFTRPESGVVSFPMFYLLDFDKKVSDDGYKIGFCEDKDLVSDDGLKRYRNCPLNPSPFFVYSNYLIYDLNGLGNDQIDQLGFSKMTSEQIYQEIYKGYE